MKTIWSLSYFFLIISLSYISGAKLLAAERKITILHTNDLHSHFRKNTTPLHLGGIARIKTAVDKVRKTHPDALLVDGGDWSEGDIYYTEGAGAESIRMMDLMGYDAAVIGNHDWINGPDVLLDSIQKTNSRVSFVSANLDTSQYKRELEFKSLISPYVIKKQGNIKIAFIGISTYEFVYDQFFAPVKITEPFYYTRTLSTQLKSEGKADIVVLISHNSVFANQAILNISPDVDLIISGHDHKKLTEPVVVKRSDGSESWIVETGSWGEFLGRVDLSIEENNQNSSSNSHKKVKLLRYQLTQIDSNIAEDPLILNEIENLERKIQAHFGPIFDDKLGKSEIAFERLGQNSGIGNLITDAYLKTTGADFSMDSTRFIYGELHPGPIRTVDAFNANPAVYDPKTQKTWSVKILPVRGRTLQWFLYALYASKKVSSFDLLNVSGLHFVYDPVFSPSVADPNWENARTVYNMDEDWFENLKEDPFFIPPNNSVFKTTSIPTVASISVQGEPLDTDKLYRVATGSGLIEGLRLYNSYSPYPISLDGLEDTGLENWRVLADYIHVNSPLTEMNVPIENRIQTLKPDLAIFHQDIHFLPSKNSSATVLVRVKNYGAMQSPEKTAKIRLLLNQNGNNQNLHPNYIDLGEPIALNKLAPDESQFASWEIRLPPSNRLYEITAKIEGNLPQVHLNNLEATQWVSF